MERFEKWGTLIDVIYFELPNYHLLSEDINNLGTSRRNTDSDKNLTI